MIVWFVRIAQSFFSLEFLTEKMWFINEKILYLQRYE